MRFVHQLPTVVSNFAFSKRNCLIHKSEYTCTRESRVYSKCSKDMLEYTQSKTHSTCKSIKTFDIFNLLQCPHSKLKDKREELVLLCFL